MNDLTNDLTLNPYEVLCNRVCPELMDGPFYIVRLPSDLPMPFDVGAYADKYPSYSIREHLIETNRWRGMGPAIVYCLSSPSLGITLHELGHLLPLVEYSADDEPSEASRKLESLAMAAWASGKIPPIDPGEPWKQHEAPWIRSTLHLWWRAVHRWGYSIHPAELNVAGQRYGLSGGRNYLEAIGNEPERLADCTFNEIETITPPQEFTDLFQRDVEKWHREHPKQEKLS